MDKIACPFLRFGLKYEKKKINTSNIYYFFLFCICIYGVEVTEKREGFFNTDGSYVKVGKYFYIYLNAVSYTHLTLPTIYSV